MERVQRVVSRHYGATQVAIVLAAFETYELLRRAMQPNWPLAVRHARDVVSVERLAHVQWEDGVQRAFLHVPELVRAMNVFYLGAHFVVTAAFFVWLYRRSRPSFRRFRNGFLAATAIALAIHWGFPTAPPRLAGIGLEDTLRQLSGIDIGSRAGSAFSDPVAAVPSLHVGWAVGVGAGLALYARRAAWRVAGAVYPVVVALTTVVTGNHFLLDAIGGAIVMGAGFLAAHLLFERPTVLRSRLRRGVEQSGSSPGS